MTPTGGKSSTVCVPLPGLKDTLLQKKLRSMGYKCPSDFKSSSTLVQEVLLVLLEHCPWICDSSHVPVPVPLAQTSASPGGVERWHWDWGRQCRLCALLSLWAQGQDCPFQVKLETWVKTHASSVGWCVPLPRGIAWRHMNCPFQKASSSASKICQLRLPAPQKEPYPPSRSKLVPRGGRCAHRAQGASITRLEATLSPAQIFAT